jgi:hypothetical protein
MHDMTFETVLGLVKLIVPCVLVDSTQLVDAVPLLEELRTNDSFYIPRGMQLALHFDQPSKHPENAICTFRSESI